MDNIIKKLRIEKKITQSELANKLGLVRSAICNYESGRRQPDPETLNKLADYFNVSVDYLLGRTESKNTIDFARYDNIFQINVEQIPLFGEIACGKPIFASEDRESYILSGTKIKADFCLIAKGDSMINARIHDGDIVFVKQQEMVNNGDIAVVLIGDEATLKRVYYYPEKSKLVLNPENPKYEPFVYIGAELNEIKILGKAIAFQSDVK